ncbi:hypothetical protein Pmar_PMAR028449, partial [Perkinsus marinus ATCC 50983]
SLVCHPCDQLMSRITGYGGESFRSSCVTGERIKHHRFLSLAGLIQSRPATTQPSRLCLRTCGTSCTPSLTSIAVVLIISRLCLHCWLPNWAERTRRMLSKTMGDTGPMLLRTRG